jgi:hypothetical protein
MPERLVHFLLRCDKIVNILHSGTEVQAAVRADG